MPLPISHITMTLSLGKLLFLFGKQIDFLVTESVTHSIVVYGLLCSGVQL